MNVTPSNNCPGCSALFTPEKPMLIIEPCGHLVHKACMKSFESCQECTTEIEAVKTWSQKKPEASTLEGHVNSSGVSALKLPAGNEPVAPGAGKPLTIDLNLTQQKEIEEVYNNCLDILLNGSLLGPNSDGHILSLGHVSDKHGFHRAYSDFTKAGRWIEFLLKTTLQKLNIGSHSIQAGADIGNYAETASSSKFAFVVLNSTLENFIQKGQFPADDEDERVAFHSWRILKGRAEKDQKSRNTFIINLLPKSETKIEHCLANFKRYHVTDLKSLYAAHLKIAGSILNSNVDLLDRILSIFNEGWQSVISGDFRSLKPAPAPSPVPTTTATTTTPKHSLEDKAAQLALLVNDSSKARQTQREQTIEKLIDDIFAAVTAAKQKNPIPNDIYVRYDAKLEKSIHDEVVQKLRKLKVTIFDSFEIETITKEKVSSGDYHHRDKRLTEETQIKHPAFLVRLGCI